MNIYMVRYGESEDTGSDGIISFHRTKAGAKAVMEEAAEAQRQYCTIERTEIQEDRITLFASDNFQLCWWWVDEVELLD